MSSFHVPQFFAFRGITTTKHGYIHTERCRMTHHLSRPVGYSILPQTVIGTELSGTARAAQPVTFPGIRVSSKPFHQNESKVICKNKHESSRYLACVLMHVYNSPHDMYHVSRRYLACVLMTKRVCPHAKLNLSSRQIAWVLKSLPGIAGNTCRRLYKLSSRTKHTDSQHSAVDFATTSPLGSVTSHGSVPRSKNLSLRRHAVSDVAHVYWLSVTIFLNIHDRELACKYVPWQQKKTRNLRWTPGLIRSYCTTGALETRSP